MSIAGVPSSNAHFRFTADWLLLLEDNSVTYQPVALSVIWQVTLKNVFPAMQLQIGGIWGTFWYLYGC
jgi:hypothetical protein